MLFILIFERCCFSVVLVLPAPPLFRLFSPDEGCATAKLFRPELTLANLGIWLCLFTKLSFTLIQHQFVVLFISYHSNKILKRFERRRSKRKKCLGKLSLDFYFSFLFIIIKHRVCFQALASINMFFSTFECIRS